MFTCYVTGECPPALHALLHLQSLSRSPLTSPLDSNLLPVFLFLLCRCVLPISSLLTLCILLCRVALSAYTLSFSLIAYDLYKLRFCWWIILYIYVLVLWALIAWWLPTILSLLLRAYYRCLLLFLWPLGWTYFVSCLTYNSLCNTSVMLCITPLLWRFLPTVVLLMSIRPAFLGLSGIILIQIVGHFYRSLSLRRNFLRLSLLLILVLFLFFLLPILIQIHDI